MAEDNTFTCEPAVAMKTAEEWAEDVRHVTLEEVIRAAQLDARGPVRP